MRLWCVSYNQGAKIFPTLWGQKGQRAGFAFQSLCLRAGHSDTAVKLFAHSICFSVTFESVTSQVDIHIPTLRLQKRWNWKSARIARVSARVQSRSRSRMTPPKSDAYIGIYIYINIWSMYIYIYISIYLSPCVLAKFEVISAGWFCLILENIPSSYPWATRLSGPHTHKWASRSYSVGNHLFLGGSQSYACFFVGKLEEPSPLWVLRSSKNCASLKNFNSPAKFLKYLFWWPIGILNCSGIDWSLEIH